MDDLDLDLDRTPGDDGVAVALRAALTPPDEQVRRVLAGLPQAQTRARRTRRRSLVATNGLALAAAAAVAVVGFAAPWRSHPAGGPVAPAASSTAGPSQGDPVLPPLTRDSLLRAESITVFGTKHPVVVESAPEDLSGRPAYAGVCVTGALPGPAPTSAWTSSWRYGDPGADGLVETVWRWDSAAPAAAAMRRLQAQVPGCSAGPGQEGRGVTRLVDINPPPGSTPGEYVELDPGTGYVVNRYELTTVADDGTGQKLQVQVVVQAGNTLLQIDALMPAAGGPKTAVWLLQPAVDLAIQRALEGSR